MSIPQKTSCINFFYFLHVSFRFSLFLQERCGYFITFPVFSLRDEPKRIALAASLELADSHQTLCKCTEILRKLDYDIPAAYRIPQAVQTEFHSMLLDSHKISEHFTSQDTPPFFFPRRIHQHYLTSLRPQVVSK